MKYVSVLLYRTLGERLPQGLATAAPIWGIAQMFVQGNRKAAAKAGFGGRKSTKALSGHRIPAKGAVPRRRLQGDGP